MNDNNGNREEKKIFYIEDLLIWRVKILDMSDKKRPLDNTRFTESATFSCLENLTETSLELTLVHCGKEHCHPLHLCRLPRHEYIIHFILDGKGTFTTDGKSWNLEKGQMFILYPDSKYAYMADADEPWTYAWIGFTGVFVENILYHCGFSADHPVNPFDDTALVEGYIDRLIEHRQLSFANNLRRQGILEELFAYLIDLNNSAGVGEKELPTDYSANVYVNHAIEYIKFFYMQDISVTTIADYVGISRNHLNNCFQKELGISIQKFLLDFRLHTAANMLVSSTDAIQTIGDQVGYPDALTFSKAFKKKFGVNPKNYRSQQQNLDLYNEKQ